MSVNSKMTAIADKIRSLLGLSGTMGLDAMATNLGIEQTNIERAFTEIGNKGGNVPNSKVSGNLVTAINSIPSGVTVQKVSGTFDISGNNVTYIDCGFVPDVFVIHQNLPASGDYYSLAIAFEGDPRVGQNGKYTINGALWTSLSDEYDVYDVYASITDDGEVAVSIYATNWSWETEYVNQTFNYVAIKYT